MAGTESPRAGLQASAVEQWPGSELAVSAERWAVLAPRLRTLMDDFRQLEALDDPTLEPVTSAGVVDWADDAG